MRRTSSLPTRPALIIAMMLLAVGVFPTFGRPIETQIGPTTRTRHGAVVSVSLDASKIGRDALIRGGTAVDAAVATAFALAVTFPEAGNIGGGGFMLVHPGPGKEPVFFDYRERAPAAATRDMFVRKSQRTQYRLVGVPGTVRGLAMAQEKHGRLAWRDLVEPAVTLAREGFVVNETLARSLNAALRRPGEEANEMRRVLGKPGGGRWSAGDRLVQPELANTLQRIAVDGPDAFYTGPIAEALIETLAAHGGLITTEDLADYHAKQREPIHGTFRGYDVYGPAPPSSGGICIVLMLNMLETFDLREREATPRMHLTIEAMRRAFHERARHLGDAGFVEIPAHLTTKTFARELAEGIDPKAATSSVSLAPDLLAPAKESEHTTHFSIIDADGMAVSNTYTLEQSYGGRIMVEGRGFLLNNEMGDFNPVPGETDRHGQIGTPANLVAPGKRMLSSMTPVLVTKDGRPVMITGSPGGRTIINTVLCVLLNRLEYALPPRQCVDAPRYSMTWLPDVVTVEPSMLLRDDVNLDALKSMGHRITPIPRTQGDAHTIVIEPDGTIVGVADQRRTGTAAGY